METMYAVAATAIATDAGVVVVAGNMAVQIEMG